MLFFIQFSFILYTIIINMYKRILNFIQSLKKAAEKTQPPPSNSIPQSYIYDMTNLHLPLISNVSFCARMKRLLLLVIFVLYSPFEISVCPSITITDLKDSSVTSICTISSTSNSSTVNYLHFASTFSTCL